MPALPAHVFKHSKIDDPREYRNDDRAPTGNIPVQCISGDTQRPVAAGRTRPIVVRRTLRGRRYACDEDAGRSPPGWVAVCHRRCWLMSDRPDAGQADGQGERHPVRLPCWSFGTAAVRTGSRSDGSGAAPRTDHCTPCAPDPQRETGSDGHHAAYRQRSAERWMWHMVRLPCRRARPAKRERARLAARPSCVTKAERLRRRRPARGDASRHRRDRSRRPSGPRRRARERSRGR